MALMLLLSITYLMKVLRWVLHIILRHQSVEGQASTNFLVSKKPLKKLTWKLRRKSTKFGGASQLMVHCFFCIQMIKQSSFGRRKRLSESQDGQASAMSVSNGSTSNGISNGNHSVKNF
ncbi:hypothetical protein REPUB_Repub11eG0000900 [Reevesia pubescens]